MSREVLSTYQKINIEDANLENANDCKRPFLMR